MVLGLGLGGFLDGIVLHQLLEWHHMLSGWYPLVSRHNERTNMIGDGLFHLLCWLLVVIGIVLLMRAGGVRGPGARRRLVGGLIGGWGAFNVVEGIVDHLILGVHHVRQGPHQLAYDLGFVALGGVLFLIGSIIARSGGPLRTACSR